MSEALFLEGQWVTPGRTKPVINPYSGEAVFHVCQAEQNHLDTAVRSASRAFRSGALNPTYVRTKVLHEASRILEGRKDEFCRLITTETGKPISFSRQEVDRAVLTLALASEESRRIEGAVLPLDLVAGSKGKEALVRRFPIGPVLAITPFNFPLNLVAHKLGPAFACGCPVILKPSSSAPVTSLRLAAIFAEAGLPDGYLSVLPCAGEDLAQVVENEAIKLITFTGSPSVGWSLKRRAGKKRVVLELGGNAAVIAHYDCDPSVAAKKIALGGFGNAGQSCISVQRVYGHEKIYDALKDSLLQAAAEINVGDPFDSHTVVGPMITEEAAKKVENWIESAVAHGGRILLGGDRKGAVLPPTILSDVQKNEPVVCNEVFAPVIVLQKYATEDEVIQEVNDSVFGLQAGLFTENAAFAFRAFRELEVGGVVINDVSSYRMDSMPYGGTKESGFGREGVRYAIEEMTELKVMVHSWRM